ncbi:helix-turn-helix transcriptional regulator [Desulfofundulus sp. TPOSR]|uniref:helix-turn-helix transcriptional regulator n=1 Tax=Desulfofundulus sp. TPOSR TaxID=2714340 RepID=UPI00140A4F68|nr:helix-turn-helix transcriptional regulator [Desulfofundulus sp. TPOSR]MBE3586635.1 helix-turn-helix transcriptional regulator [Thermoanaerobacter sp.]NHM28923.1 helix-turn-helix transcriptional regulator [Desulfofundulus sp. TPOSR]
MKRTRLIEARKNAGLSLRQLAQQLGISKSLVVSIENCRCNPSWEVAQRLEKFFGIPVGELLAVEPEQPASQGNRNQCLRGSSERPTR